MRPGFHARKTAVMTALDHPLRTDRPGLPGDPILVAAMSPRTDPGRDVPIAYRHPPRTPETVMTTTSTLSGRDRAILRAVAAGGAELALGAEPDLFLDGRCCCDQSAAHHLVRSGLIAACRLGLVGQRVAAALTPAGQQALDVAAIAA
jgi:hypothetical protein